jgi:hypothetical protein
MEWNYFKSLDLVCETPKHSADQVNFIIRRRVNVSTITAVLFI